MEIRNDSFKAQPARHHADFTRPNREAIERGTPGVDDIRAQQARAKAEQAARMEAAEAKESAQRIEAARAVHAERLTAARLYEGRKVSAPAAETVDTVDIAPDVADADAAERARMADEALEAERASGARDQLALQAQRAEAARALLSERAGGARDQLALSETSMRLRADAQPADEAARAERVAELKALFQQGRLNTDELVARASYNLLSGE
jgi:anti-sigma28 factor (negative regulator of flagellin synthesis)